MKRKTDLKDFVFAETISQYYNSVFISFCQHWNQSHANLKVVSLASKNLFQKKNLPWNRFIQFWNVKIYPVFYFMGPHGHKNQTSRKPVGMNMLKFIK